MERLLEVIEKSLNFTHTSLYEPCVTDNSSWISEREENGHRNYFMINLRKSMVLGRDRMVTPGSAVRHVTDCATIIKIQNISFLLLLFGSLVYILFFNPLYANGFFLMVWYSTWDSPLYIPIGVSGYNFQTLYCFVRRSFLPLQNSVDPDDIW